MTPIGIQGQFLFFAPEFQTQKFQRKAVPDEIDQPPDELVPGKGAGQGFGDLPHLVQFPGSSLGQLFPGFGDVLHQFPVFPVQAASFQGPGHQDPEFGQAQVRFQQVVISPQAQGLHHALQAAMAGEDDNFRIRGVRLDVGEEIQAGIIGEHQVQKGQSELLGLDGGHGLLSVHRHRHFVPLVGQKLLKRVQ